MGNSTSRSTTTRPAIQKTRRVVPTLSPTSKMWMTAIGLGVGLILGGWTVGAAWTLKTAALKILTVVGTALAGAATGATVSHLPEIVVTTVNTVCYPFVGEVLTTPERLRAQQEIQNTQARRAEQNANEQQRNEQNVDLGVINDMANELNQFAQGAQDAQHQMAEQAQRVAMQHVGIQTDAANTVQTHLVINTNNTFMPAQNSPPASPTTDGPLGPINRNGRRFSNE